jgi:hypothetical protein
MHVLHAAILIFLSIFFIVHWIKPVALFDEDGSLREFGVGSTRKTVTPMWLVAILVAIAAYSAAHYRFG